MNIADEMLQKREIRGLRLTLGVRLFFVVTQSISLYSSQSALETGMYIIAITIMMLVLGLFAYWLHGEKHLQLIGYGGAVQDSIFLMILPVIFYYSVGGNSVNPTYNLKTMIGLLSIVLIVINSMPIRPVYPLIIAGTSVFIHLALFAFAYNDGRMEFTDRMIEDFMGTKIVPTVFFIKAFLVGVIGVLMALLTSRMRKATYEAVQLEKSNSQMGRYFSPNVMEKISGADEEFLKPGGIKQNVAVLFCDIRDFTALSESVSPEEVVEMLSEYHGKMVDVIFKHGGTLDKFIGDAIMATFGTPDVAEDDPIRAVRAGIGMQSALKELNQKRVKEGKPEIKNGIGIHYGSVIAGNIGTRDRLEYTVIGDAVNTASRLESACKSIGSDFIISLAVKERLPEDIKTNALGKLKVKGKTETIEVFSV